MMKTIVCALPEIDFVVDETEKINPTLLEEKNVRTEKITKKSQYPKLVVTGCGFMINSKEALYTELVSLLKRKRAGDYCLGCNIEPLDGCIRTHLIANKLNKFRLIVCRDKKSLVWLEKHVNKPQKEYLPDILFGMPDSWFPMTGCGKSLGISLMHRKGDAADCAYYKSMAHIADFWVEKTGDDVLLMAFDSGLEDDVYSCDCVRNLMKCREKAKIVIHKNGGEIFKAYSECAKIIGARFHSAPLAFKMGLPFYPIVYREKMKNLIDDLAYPVCGCRIDEIHIKDIENFVMSEMSYKPDEKIISASQEYAKIFREALDKG